MPYKENTFSLWAGIFTDEASLQEYVEPIYSDNALISSDFIKETGIDWYDADLAEASFCKNNTPDICLRMHSYGDSFPQEAVNDLKQAGEFNSLYLIYDFLAKPAKSSGRIKFVGAYSYKK